MPRRRVSRTPRTKRGKAAILRRHLASLRPYLVSPSSDVLPLRAKARQSRRLTFYASSFTYHIPPLPYPHPPSSSKWNSLDEGDASAFFRYEAWLRSRRVREYVQTRQGRRFNPHHTIGGIPRLNLAWLLQRGHHSLLARRSHVRDISAELTYFGRGLFTEIGLRLLKDNCQYSSAKSLKLPKVYGKTSRPKICTSVSQQQATESRFRRRSTGFWNSDSGG